MGYLRYEPDTARTGLVRDYSQLPTNGMNCWTRPAVPARDLSTGVVNEEGKKSVESSHISRWRP